MAEEAVLIRERIGPDDVDLPHPGRPQACRTITGEVELPACLPLSVAEKPVVGRVVHQERITQIGGNFIGALANTGTNRGRHPRPIGAQCFHGGDRGLDYAGQGAAPARMRRADNAGGRM